MKFTVMLDSYGSGGKFVVGLDASAYYDHEDGYWSNHILDFTIQDLEELNLVEYLSKTNASLEVETRLMAKTKPEPIFQNQTQSIRGFLEKNRLGSARIRNLCEKHGIDLDSPWPPDFPSGAHNNSSAAEPLKRTDAPAPGGSAKVIRLPVWPEAVRGVPNGVLRSALFGAIRKGPRRYMERQEIHAQEGITIRYTGARLDQGDLDVWETVLHLVRLQAMGEQCRFTAYSMLKMLGKADTGGNRGVLDRRMARLKATAVDVKVGRYSYMGSLIDEVFKDDETREYVIQLNPKLRALFAGSQFTQIEWAVRHALDGQPLAQWLHGFYASHAEPYPVKVETLHKLCGSEAALLSDFKKDVRRALDAIAKASKANGQPFRYEIRSDLVHVERQPSRSQQKHLAKKPRKPRQGVLDL